MKTFNYRDVFNMSPEPPLNNIDDQFNQINQKLSELDGETYKFSQKHKNHEPEVQSMKAFIVDAHKFLE